MKSELKTITGQTFHVSTNYSLRTFTIYTESAKYRTLKMSQDEFNDAMHNTGKDWQNFLLTTQDYYKVN
jgi:arsenate reductase-like glutaredoxin family protein